MRAMFSHTAVDLTSFTARCASSRLPIVRLYEKSTSARRVPSSTASIPTKSRITSARSRRGGGGVPSAPPPSPPSPLTSIAAGASDGSPTK